MVCVQVFNNKPSDSLQSSHQVPCSSLGERHALMQREGKNGGFPQSRLAKPPLIARGVQKSRLWGSSVLTGCLRAGAGVPERVPQGFRTSKGRQISDKPPGPAMPPSTSPACGASPHPVHLVQIKDAW